MEISHNVAMFFDETIASAKELSQALDESLARVLAMDPDTSDADDFAHIQGLFRHFAGQANSILAMYVAILEGYERNGRELIALRESFARNTAEIERIADSSGHPPTG